MMIGVTSFFRDPDAWEVLRTEVIQPLVTENTEVPVRVWSPACATGEEPYSIAMMLQDEINEAGSHRDFTIFATDIDTQALSRAREGRYPERDSSDIPQKYIKDYVFCAEEHGLLMIKNDLREHLVFASQNVFTDPPFSHMDLIICRNLLIYLKSEAQLRCLDVFHYALKSDGILFLGTAESIEGKNNLFSQLGQKHARIYRKCTVVFREMGKGKAVSQKEPDTSEESGIRSLEYELNVIREDNKRTVTQLKKLNKELHESNRELQAANEELKTSREELQSFNEELATRNQQIHQSELNLSTIIDVLPVGVITADSRGGITRINQATREIWGVPPWTVSSEQSGDWIGWWPKTGERIKSDEWALTRTLRTGEVIRNELVRNEKFGTHEHRYYLSNAVPLRDNRGRITGGVVAMLDVTEWFAIEQELRASEQRFRALATAGFAAVYRMNPDWSVLFQLNGQNFLQDAMESNSDWMQVYIPQEEQSRVLEAINNSIRTRSLFELEHRIIQADGSIGWTYSHAVPLFDKNGEIYEWFGTARNITDRKHAEESLREREELFRTLADNISQFAWMANPKGRIFWYNKRWYDYTGTTLGEMQGWGWKKILHPDHVDRVVSRIQHSLDTGELWEDTFSLRSKEGEYRWFLSRALPVRNDKKEIIRWFGTNTDITERLGVEMSLENRTRELINANHDLKSFSYSVSHDLRNPLGMIAGFTNFLIEDYSERLDEVGRDFLRRINENVKKMQTLINDMLNLSRISRQEMNCTDVNLSAIVLNYLAELGSIEPDRKVECDIEENVHANADPRLIHLALENLLCNAWKFTAKKETAHIAFGVINYESELLNKKLKKTSQLPIPNFLIKTQNPVPVYFIRDNGVGFDMKFALRIFEPFKRVHAQKEFGGTGVGLSIVQRVVERHGGWIWAEGEMGKGATFYFTL